MKPPLACKSCRARKKKCDRAYPACGYCLRTHNQCEYRINGHEAQTTTQTVSLTLPTNQNDSTQRHLFNGAMFLGYPGPTPSLRSSGSGDDSTLGVDLRPFIFSPDQRHPRQLVADFIEIVDPWLPFIPRQELMRLSRESSQVKGDNILLLSCMKLNTERPRDGEATNRLYLAVKSALVNVEVFGTLSVRLLQSLLLLLIYEHGHGIYPSAYITLGTCIRYLTALGILSTSEGDDSECWLDGEAQRRLWWSIYVVERIMALGYPQRPLLMEEPLESQILPSDDISWQQQCPARHYAPLTILSPATSDMGTFRLLAHAGYLLGRVIQFVSNYCSGHESGSRRRTQLYRTISALMKVLEVEDQTSIVSVRLTRSILNSALFALFTVGEGDDDEFGVMYDSKHPLSISAETFLNRSRIALAGGLGDPDTVCPFLLNWAFHAFRYYRSRYHRDGHPESLAALKDLIRSLEVISWRWKLAGVYMILLNGTQ